MSNRVCVVVFLKDEDVWWDCESGLVDVDVCNE